ncbi:hypothetical protein BWD09_05485 [Neisseria dentiae]|uniref:Uncharacterized protein n=1 Tax=Neisseria dentiae TaxID=194197 RepID=A0A1X3DCC0_9NEIS|nr:hypothetical protein BWD09_05485 [Neisseria dentiae]
MVKIRSGCVKNARKIPNLAVLFALHLRIFPQKTASQAFRLHSLNRPHISICARSRRSGLGAEHFVFARFGSFHRLAG